MKYKTKSICGTLLIAIVICSSFFYFTDTKLEGELVWQLIQTSRGFNIYQRIYNNRVAIIEEEISKNFSFEDCSINSKWVKDANLSNIQKSFSFSNEKCSDIVNLHHDTFPIMENGKDWFLSHYTDEYPLTADKTRKNNYSITFENNGFHVVSDSLDDHWIYIVSKKKMPKKYAVEFDYFSKTAICEQLQFDIFASSLADRFRVISEYGELVFFDAVQKGYFLKRFYEKECPMPIGLTNHIRLEVNEEHIVYYVNHKKELCVTIKDYPIKQAHMIILFWNRIDKKPIDITISNFAIYTEKGGH